jgi:hypothetical protein
MIRNGAREAAGKLREEPDSFGYPDLSPPYVRTARFREREGQPPRRTRDEHPDSIIELINMPFTTVEEG